MATETRTVDIIGTRLIERAVPGRHYVQNGGGLVSSVRRTDWRATVDGEQWAPQTDLSLLKQLVRQHYYRAGFAGRVIFNVIRPS